MSKIFLSYRREDSAGAAGRIYDRLCAHFGRDNVFFDVDSVPLGVDFQEHIESVLSRCDVFLAVIGPNWAGESNTGRRIDSPEDWVRIEIEVALKRGLPLIPVLIDHTRMPSKADLPPSLVPVVRRNAVTVDQGRDFHVHVDRLIQGIELLFQRAKVTTYTPTITTDPTNTTVTAGQTATFTAAASGNPAPTVQWQVSTDGINFSNIPGATSTTLSITNAAPSQDGTEYQAVFTNSVGTATSKPAILTVGYAPIPPSSPADSGQRSTPIPGRQPLPERRPSASDAAPRQQEPTVRSLLRGALLLLLALTGIILALKPIGNREATSLQKPQPPQPKRVPTPSTTTWDAPKNFPRSKRSSQHKLEPEELQLPGTRTWDAPKNFLPPQEPQPPQPKREWTNSIGIELVRIEAGSFLMGSTKDQIDQLMRPFPNSKREWFDIEQPQHSVEITRPFFLGIHEVTQGQYQAVMGENPSHSKGSDDLPVEQVSWLDAVLFCNKLSEQEKRMPFYRINGTEVTIAGGNGYRLPTEAEWEYACRAGSTTLYPFGDEVSKLGDHAWFDNLGIGTLPGSGSRTRPVGLLQPNAWGLYDMLGNVSEWCQDWYEAGYYRVSPPADPPDPAKASDRVIRGGSWYDGPGGSRPAIRGGRTPGERQDFGLGFRVAAVQE